MSKRHLANRAVVFLLVAVFAVANFSTLFRLDYFFFPVSLSAVTTTTTTTTTTNMDSVEEEEEHDEFSRTEIQCFAKDDHGTKEKPLPKLPTFIIAGAQKAGTSAIYYLLEQIAGFQPSLGFEPHFFDQRGHLGPDASALSDQDVCQARRNYLEFFPHNGSFPLERDEHGIILPSISFEKTPIYLCKPAVPALIQRVVPWAKIVVVLRNPVDRVYSAYKMARQRAENETTVLTFEEMVINEIRQLRSMGLSVAPSYQKFANNRTRPNDFALPVTATIARRNSLPGIMEKMVSRSMYAQQLVNWIGYNNSNNNSSSNNSSDKHHQHKYYKVGSNLAVFRYEAFLANQSHVLTQLFDFVGARTTRPDLPRHVLRGVYNPTRGMKRNYSEPMQPMTRAYLQQFYQPYNDELADLLGDEWRNVWW